MAQMQPDAKDTMKKFGEDFLRFLNASPTPFHVCLSASKLLLSAGFIKINESEAFLSENSSILEPGGKYFFTRNESSIVAFTIGQKYKPGNPFKIIGAHTDSPVLRVKPVSNRSSYGLLQLGVECYGGGLWHTWLDRDLSVAGRVIISTDKNKFEKRLVHIEKPILRVPSLCIHLQTGEERAKLAINKEKDLLPILGLVKEGLEESKGRHGARFLQEIAKQLSCKVVDIMDFDLSLFDTQGANFGGVDEEFVFSGHLDNQIHSFTSIRAILEHNVVEDEGIAMSVLFDHEEVGSDSNEGAGSPLLRDSVNRISAALGLRADVAPAKAEELFKVSLNKSLLLSADSAHAVHPSFTHKHESKHQPKMGKGTVIKTNQNQRYMTNGVTGFIVRELCRRNNLPVQEFVVPNHSGCGSTIGPILASGVGMRTVDIGVPQLSMHSIREQCAVEDVFTNYELMKAFLKESDVIDASISSSY
eukprot:augustus_masked-scaffold_35-processed-gene-1.2-mRNA-1 protein AED:0.01 eAED:0.01 QI:0/-1/0/1/-1/1/1/0/473